MKNIVEYISESERISLINEYIKDNFNVDGFIILDMSDESLVSQWGTGDLQKCIKEILKLKEQDSSKEYWIVATINGGYYDINDEGNHVVLKSLEYNEKDEYYGINPKFNEYLS